VGEGLHRRGVHGKSSRRLPGGRSVHAQAGGARPGVRHRPTRAVRQTSHPEQPRRDDDQPGRGQAHRGHRTGLPLHSGGAGRGGGDAATPPRGHYPGRGRRGCGTGAEQHAGGGQSPGARPAHPRDHRPPGRAGPLQGHGSRLRRAGAHGGPGRTAVHPHLGRAAGRRREGACAV